MKTHKKMRFIVFPTFQNTGVPSSGNIKKFRKKLQVKLRLAPLEMEFLQLPKILQGRLAVVGDDNLSKGSLVADVE